MYGVSQGRNYRGQEPIGQAEGQQNADVRRAGHRIKQRAEVPIVSDGKDIQYSTHSTILKYRAICNLLLIYVG